MARILIMTTMVAVLVLGVSVSVFARKQGSYQTTYPEKTGTYQPTYHSTGPPSLCRNITQLCLNYGDYNCCGDLSCTAWMEHLPVGVGVCTPIGKKPTPPADECQSEDQLCHPYGQYQCCEGLHCVDTRNYNPDLPPGVGVCEHLKL